ncbi:MAG: hypothetical protein RRB24_03910, partial [Armatimonadota bacterium]|nr:hypothetical protein [Armatimonadota bacterium]MDT7971952.1 hypothetical protein [Armatimonadota bacterium]
APTDRRHCGQICRDAVVPLFRSATIVTPFAAFRYSHPIRHRGDLQVSPSPTRWLASPSHPQPS